MLAEVGHTVQGMSAEVGHTVQGMSAEVGHTGAGDVDDVALGLARNPHPKPTSVNYCFTQASKPGERLCGKIECQGPSQLGYQVAVFLGVGSQDSRHTWEHTTETLLGILIRSLLQRMLALHKPSSEWPKLGSTLREQNRVRTKPESPPTTERPRSWRPPEIAEAGARPGTPPEQRRPQRFPRSRQGPRRCR